jgi:hypothetical protein
VFKSHFTFQKWPADRQLTPEYSGEVNFVPDGCAGTDVDDDSPLNIVSRQSINLDSNIEKYRLLKASCSVMKCNARLLI